MTQPLRDTRYARELASAKLPSRPGGKSFVAIERIFAEQVEIRFSLWEGSRMMPRLMTESWSGAVAGSGQLHEITPTGARLLGEGFV
jgi:hypothetical protein